MPSASKSFENDCSEALKDARNIIEHDMRAFTTANQQRLSEALAATEQNIVRLRQMVQPFFLTMSAFTLLIIAMTLAVSWYWAGLMINRAQSASLWQMGLQINQTPSGKILTWDARRLHLISCQNGKGQMPCLQIVEKE